MCSRSSQGSAFFHMMRSGGRVFCLSGTRSTVITQEYSIEFSLILRTKRNAPAFLVFVPVGERLRPDCHPVFFVSRYLT